MAPTGLNDIVDAYQVIEVAARGERSLFLAVRSNEAGFYWLLESAAPLAEVKARLGGASLFESGGLHYLALDVSAATVATLLALVPRLDPAFIGWRWVRLAESLAPLHQAGQTLPRERPLTLNSLKFTKSSQISFSPFADLGGQGQSFAAPEAGDGLPTPASDVYALGASLQAAIGGAGANARLAKVLARAMANDPRQRQADGRVLARELKKALPRRAVGNLRDDPVEETQSAGNAFGTLDGIIMAFGPIAALGILILGFLFFKDNAPTVDWSRFPFIFGGTPAADTTGGVARARGTPVPLPAGALSFDDYSIDLDAPCSVRIETMLSKGGVPLPAGAAVDFDVWLNGRAMSGVVVAPGSDLVVSRYTLAFSAPGFCPGGGAVRVRARAGDGEGELSVCEFGQPSDAAGVASLEGISLVGAQVDAAAFPALAAYFTAINTENAGTRLRGPFRCDLSVDNTPVKGFGMSAVDTQASPVTVALVMDVSGSMRGAPLTNARTAAAEFVRQIGPGSPICIYSFATNQAVTLAALDGLTAEGNTALYDVLISIASNQRRLGGRQAVIVLSDGADTVKRTTLAEALAQVQQLNVPVYTIGLQSPDLNPDILRQIASRTGGIYLEAPDSAALRGLYQKLRGQLVTQYQLRFDAPAPDRKAGTFTFRVLDRDRTLELTRAYTAAP